MPDGEDHPESWVFHMAMAFHGDPVNSLSYPDRLALVKARAATMGEPARSAFMWIPDDTLVHNVYPLLTCVLDRTNRSRPISATGSRNHGTITAGA